MVRIPGFHPGDPGSIPGRGNINENYFERVWRNWQRVGFQTRRLGVRVPLPSMRYFHLNKQKKCTRAWSSWL